LLSFMWKDTAGSKAQIDGLTCLRCGGVGSSE
jgi:hypothetical protein